MLAAQWKFLLTVTLYAAVTQGLTMQRDLQPEATPLDQQASQPKSQPTANAFHLNIAYVKKDMRRPPATAPSSSPNETSPKIAIMQTTNPNVTVQIGPGLIVLMCGATAALVGCVVFLAYRSSKSERKKKRYKPWVAKKSTGIGLEDTANIMDRLQVDDEQDSVSVRYPDSSKEFEIQVMDDVVKAMTMDMMEPIPTTDAWNRKEHDGGTDVDTVSSD